MRLTINFLMKKARLKPNGEIPIYVRFTLNSKRVELSTGIYCLPETWDDAVQQIRGRNETVRILNNRLNKIEDDIQDHYNQLKSSGEDFDVTTIKNRLLHIDDSEGILMVFDYYLKNMHEKLGKGYSKETYKHYKSSRKRLATFIKDHYKKNDYLVQTIKFGFLDAFGVAVISQVQNTVLKQDKTMFQLDKCFFHQFHISPNPSRNTSVTIHVYSSII